MIDYRSIWLSLNEDSKKNAYKPFIARRIPSKGAFAVFLATDAFNSIRYLFIHLSSLHDLDIEDLPHFIGLEAALINTSIGSFKNQDFLRLKQVIPNTENISELVISDLCEHVITIEDPSTLKRILNAVLSGWKVFFEKRSTKILTIQQQKGLFSEIYFLKEYLIRKVGLVHAIQCWTAADKSNHDFQLGRSAVEIKSTSSKQHRKFVVSSEKQLDNTGLDILILTLLSLNLHAGRPDMSLPTLVQEVDELLKEDSAAYFQFNLKLTKAGFNREHSGKYRTGFSIAEKSFFQIRDDFPRILSADLPPGIGDIKYSVVVAACEPFKVSETILNNI